jgi:hypothetical protein
MHLKECLDTCPSGFRSDNKTGNCEVGDPITEYKTIGPQGNLIYFPFLILALIFSLVALLGKKKNKKSMFLTNCIALLGLLEFFTLFT